MPQPLPPHDLRALHASNGALRLLERARHVLMLQGPMGPFFNDLATLLRQRGRSVHQVAFHLGDLRFAPQAHWWRGRTADFGRHIETLIARQRPDVCVLFGQDRPVHQVARAVLESQGVPLLVFEEGYVRPYFVTFEAGGVNARSGFVPPVAHGPAHPPGPDYPEQPFHLPFGPYAWRGMQYQFLLSAGRLVQRGYAHHRPMGWWHEGTSWIRSGLRKREARRSVPALIDTLVREHATQPYFVVPLQVEHDAQQRYYSGYASVADFIAQTIASFGRHAPVESRLVIKHHPMDRGHCSHAQAIAQAAAQACCAARVHYILDGHLATLLSHARGTVTANSTVGLSALWHGSPVHVCGHALYNRPGLTHQGRLDEFWQQPGTVDTARVHAFRNALIAQTQLPGSFYWPAGGYGGLLAVIGAHLPYQPPAPRPRAARVGPSIAAK